MDSVQPQTLPQNDHDLLVTIHGQVGRALTDIKELRDNVADRVNKLENEKVNRLEFQENKIEVEQRQKDILVALEKFVTTDVFWPVKTIVYTGAGIILTTVLSGLLYLIIIHR